MWPSSNRHGHDDVDDQEGQRRHAGEQEQEGDVAHDALLRLGVGVRELRLVRDDLDVVAAGALADDLEAGQPGVVDVDRLGAAVESCALSLTTVMTSPQSTAP